MVERQTDVGLPIAFCLFFYFRLTNFFRQHLDFSDCQFKACEIETRPSLQWCICYLIIIMNNENSGSSSSSLFTNQGLLGRGQSDVSSCFATEHHEPRKYKYSSCKMALVLKRKEKGKQPEKKWKKREKPFPFVLFFHRVRCIQVRQMKLRWVCSTRVSL